MRRPFDFYPTPMSVVSTMIDRMFLKSSAFLNRVWEPCSGDGRIAAELRQHDIHSVVETDISAGQNFFDFDTALAPVIVTNPPFRHIRPFIDHAFDIGVQQMALVCGERLWACKKGREQFERHRPSSFANMDWREDYLGKGGKPDRALAVSMWTSPHADHCRYEVWSRS
jgi:hypothetical protein